MKYTTKQIKFIESLYEFYTWEEIAEEFNHHFHEYQTPNALRKTYYRQQKHLLTKPKILVFDIETSPMENYTWGIWDQNVSLNQVIKDWTVLAWAAKWLGDSPEKIMYMDTSGRRDPRDDKQILKGIWKLLDEADFVVGHNSDSFDVKKLNARFLLHGMEPPSSYRRLDTKKLAKKHFSLTSNKLEYITHNLCTKYKKLKHGNFPGFSLWKECMKGNKEAWKEMKKYNEYDVLSLEEAFLKLLPWENAALFDIYCDAEIDICTCGSIDFKKAGFYYTTAGKYQKYKCKNCGAEMRDKQNLLTKQARGTKR
jgi:DNA polymerase elongation subunit (family B)